jgi:hypothetical protein
MSDLTELDVLKDVIKRLDGAAFEYMLTGSMAMNYYAEPRMTRDIDIVVVLGTADVQRISNLFKDEYYVSEDAIANALRNVTMFNLVHLVAVVKVDIIVRKPDEYRRHEFSRRISVEFAGIKAWIVSKEDLILSKLYWAKDNNSEMQLRDVKNLLGAGSDEDYLRRWAPRLGVEDLLENCLNE